MAICGHDSRIVVEDLNNIQNLSVNHSCIVLPSPSRSFHLIRCLSGCLTLVCTLRSVGDQSFSKASQCTNFRSQRPVFVFLLFVACKGPLPMPQRKDRGLCTARYRELSRDSSRVNACWVDAVWICGLVFEYFEKLVHSCGCCSSE